MSSATLNRGRGSEGLSLREAADVQLLRVVATVLEAVDTVERFVDAVEGSLPDDARVMEVLVTRPVVERARGDLRFDRVAEVRLKGFTESTEVFIARGTGSGPSR